MAFTFNGFGTKLYGVADLRPDGTFITTEWITAAYVPLIPFRSFRLIRHRAEDMNIGFAWSKGYAVLEKLPLYWPQVFRTYAFIVGLATWVMLAGWLFFSKWGILERRSAPVLFFVFMMVALSPFIGMVWLRRKAFRAQHGEMKPPRYS